MMLSGLSLSLILPFAVAVAAIGPEDVAGSENCSPRIIQASGSATSRNTAERNARLVLKRMLQREGHVTRVEYFRVKCRSLLLWRCTATARVIKCPDKKQ